MINLLKTSLFSLAIVMFSYSAANAVTLSGLGADAEVVSPLAITGGGDGGAGTALNFGTFDNVGGTVTVSETGGATTSTGGTNLFGDDSRASFTVTGQAGETYTISIPSTITLSGPGTDMSATLASDKSSGTLTSGTDSFYIGGTLTVASDQTVGSYSTTYAVTVNY